MSSTTTAPDPGWQELHANLRAFVGRRVRNQADVDDLVQRVLLRIVVGLRSLRDGDRMHAWIYRVARNVIVDYYRSPTVRRERAGGDVVDLVSTNEPAELMLHGDERAALRELAKCLQPMVGRLSPAYQDAIRMADLEGVTQAEAARRAGVSVSGMKSRVQRARQQLRALVEDCCRVDLDRRGSIMSFASRHPAQCACGGCNDPKAR